MGTRLYINTNDIDVQEQLAGVPHGTNERLTELKLKFGQGQGYECHCAVAANKELADLDNFILNGWGKFNLGLLPKERQICGSENDSRLAVELWMTATNAFNYAVDNNNVVMAIKKHGVSWG